MNDIPFWCLRHLFSNLSAYAATEISVVIPRLKIASRIQINTPMTKMVAITMSVLFAVCLRVGHTIFLHSPFRSWNHLPILEKKPGFFSLPEFFF